MRGRLIDMSFGLNRRQRVTVELDRDFREDFDNLKETDVNVEIKKWRNPRSRDANAYAWVLIDKLAAHQSLSKTEVYRKAILETGGVSEFIEHLPPEAAEHLCAGWQRDGLGWITEITPSVEDGFVNARFYYGSSSYDTLQMSRLIDNLVQDCLALGIETKTEDEIESLLEAWDGR